MTGLERNVMISLIADTWQVYLSGTNTAWIYYGSDFGNNAWDGHGDL